MAEPINEIRYHFRAASGRSKIIASSPLTPALPRIARLMALAIKLDGHLAQNPDFDCEELARRGCVSRTRVTQILNLLHLAPDIQERLLSLTPLARGREVITEKTLRRLAGDYHWERQRQAFAQLLARRTSVGN